MSTAISRRALSNEEATQLRDAIRRTPAITGYTARELAGFQDVLAATVDGHLAGACISLDLPGNWTEIAVLYVFEQYRAQGLGTALFEQAWRQVRDRARHLYVVSRTPFVLRLMAGQGMKIVPLYALPLAVQLHNLAFACHPYRIAEFFRKLPMAKGQPRFQYGIKTFEENEKRPGLLPRPER